MPLTTVSPGVMDTQATATWRNRIINGDMRIDQRNNGAAVTVNNTAVYTVDRWLVEDGCDAVFSAQRSTDVPSGQGFTNSLQVTATTADASIGSTQFAVITQIIEGFNSADLNFGTASAVSCTISFWVKATVAGQYSCTIYNDGASRINPQAFTINSSNTWEQKTITFTGDTSGTWLTNNGRGIVLNFYIALGSSYLGTAGWNSSALYGVTGQANAVSAVNNIFSITGVQLEAGTVATPFERRPYGTELALCQRYYQLFSGVYAEGYASGALVRQNFPISFPVQMRATPTRTVITAGGYTNIRSSSSAYAGLGINGLTNTYASCSMESSGAGYMAFSNQTESMSAEL